MAQGQLAVVSCRTISQNLLSFNMVALEDDGTLVYAGALVGAFEFQQRININLAVFGTHANFVTNYADNLAGTLSQYADAGVNSYLVFHTSTDNRCLGAQQGHCLTLHVSAHQRTVSVIIFQEGNQCGCNGYYLLRRNVHQVAAFRCDGKYVVLSAGSNTLAQEVALVIQGFVRLCNNVFIFFIGSHVNNFVGNALVFFINYAVRSFHEAIFIDNSEGGQGANQADVRTFRGFNGAHTAIVGVVYVADFVACALTGQTARA